MANKLFADHLTVSGNVVAYSTSIPGNATNDVGKVKSEAVAGKNAEIVTWGSDNNLPNYREDLIANNQIVPALIKRKRDLICGQSWYAYTESFIDGKRVMVEQAMPPMAKAFFKKFKDAAPKVVAELLKHELSVVEFIRALDGGLNEINPLETKYIRAGRKIKGKLAKWFWSNAWTSAMRKGMKTDDFVLESLNLYNGQTDVSTRQSKYCLVFGDWMMNDGYYPIPSYWGSRHWIELANVIPVFHAANLRNLSAPRWMLVIPHDYFTDYEALNAAITEEERQKIRSSEKAARQAFVDDFNKLVTGVENNGRTLTIQSVQEEIMGKIVDKRIQVEPLVIDLRDEALIKLYDASNVANISAQGLHPTLANIETQGRLSSGTEIRNAYLLWLIIAAPYYRNDLMAIVEHAKEQGWVEAAYEYAIRDAELTTLAENPAGVRPAQTQIGA